MKPSYFETSFKLLILMMLVGLTNQHSWAADISVSVDRNPVTVNESFNILFTASEEPDGMPDFSPLNEDFTVMHQSQSSNSSWINGQYSKSIRWTVQAIAKKSGDLTIPAIIFGQDTSKPLTITVNKTATDEVGTNVNQDLFIQVKAEPESVFIQSQVLYTVKVYRRVELTQAQLTEPELADAVVEKLGNDGEYNTVINGVSYRVTERKYAIFPQKSGALKIPPLTLTADVVVDDEGRGGPFDGFFGSAITKTKRILSNEVTLTVKPAPASFSRKHWLAAENLELEQTWSGDVQQMKTGEPITRTLTLRGIGTTVSQLPELNSLKTNGNLKVYPDQPVLKEEKLAEGVTAFRQEKIAIIPAVVGKQTLPAIEIPWFNTRTQRMETARIPETVINATGGPASTVEPKPLTQSTPPDSSTQTTSSGETTNNDKTALHTVNPESDVNLWRWTSLLLGLGWLTTLAYLIYMRRQTKVNNPSDTEILVKTTRFNEINKQLKTACQQNDRLAAKNALLTWGKQQFETSSLASLAKHCDTRLRDEIIILNQHLYRNQTDNWSGKRLYQAFCENNARKNINLAEDMTLEPLHRL